MEIMRLQLKPEIGLLQTIELTMIQPISIVEEGNQIVVYILHNPDDERWKRKVHFGVLGTGNIPDQFHQFAPIGTINVRSNTFHIFYKTEQD